MTVGFALIGTGSITERLAPAILRADGAELVAVLSRDLERADQLRAKHGADGAKSYTDLDALLEDPRVDAVAVATPDALHVNQALAAIERGKHVLVEQPMTTTTGDAEVLRYAAGRSNVALAVGYPLRHHRGHRALRELVAQGRFGTIRHARVQWTRKDADAEGWRAKGELTRWWALSAIGAHVIDLARWLLAPLGEPQIVNRTFVSPRWGGREEVASIALGFPEGALVEVFVSVLFDSPMRLEIFGDEGAAICEGTFGPHGAGTIRVDGVPLEFATVDPCQAEVEDLVAAIRDHRAPFVSAEDGLENVRILDELAG